MDGFVQKSPSGTLRVGLDAGYGIAYGRKNGTVVKSRIGHCRKLLAPKFSRPYPYDLVTFTAVSIATEIVFSMRLIC